MQLSYTCTTTFILSKVFISITSDESLYFMNQGAYETGTGRVIRCDPF